MGKLTISGRVDVDKVLDIGTGIAVINAREGTGVTAVLLSVIIADMANSFNVSRPMTPTQIGDLAADMAQELWMFRFEEVIAFFHCMKRGAYGRVYERLDAQIVWDCWSNYLEHRMEVIEIRRARSIDLDLNTPQKPMENYIGRQLAGLGDHLETLKKQLKNE